MKTNCKLIIGTFIICVCMMPFMVNAWDGSGGGGNIDLSKCSSGWCFDFLYTSEKAFEVAGAEGLRLTVVDKNGKKIDGTRSYDYFRPATYNMVMNSNYTGGEVHFNKFKATRGNKKAVHSSGVDFTSGKYTYAGQWSGIPTIISAENRSFNTEVFNFLKKEANSNTEAFMNRLRNDLGYDFSNVNGTYIQFEPIMAIYRNNASQTYVGTATEIMTLLRNNVDPNLNRSNEYYGMAWGIMVDANIAVYLSNSGSMDKHDFTYPYASGNRIVKLRTGKLNPLKEFFSSNGKNAYGHGVLWMQELIPCNWNNPEHFKDTDGDGEPDSGPGGTNCCVDPSITANHSQEEIEFAYPVCGSCDVNDEPPTSTTPACGTDGTGKVHSFTDTVSWECMYQDDSRNQMYKVSNINSYCTVYCKESTNLELPGSYQGFVPTGTSFIWPNSSTYSLTVSGTRQCKVKFDYMNWLDDYNNASSSTKNSLMNQLNACSNDNALNKGTFAYNLEPTISISGYKGYMNGRDESERLELISKNDATNITMYDVSYSGSVSNVSTSESGLRQFAKTLWENKTFTTSTSNQYVLPNDLYSYTNKQTGIISYRKPADADSDESTDGTEKYTNRGYGSWAVDDSTIPSDANRKIGNEITITYKGISASNNESHFDGYAKNYTCQYNVERSNVAVCDYQNPEQFLDLDGDGEPDSGPNGENCCNHFLVQFEGDEEKIAELLEKYPICNVDNGNTKCDYNNPSQYVGAPYGTSPGKGPNGTNCCEDLRDNYLSYGLSYAQFQELEQKYGCDSGNGPDPEGTCTPIPTVNDKSCCSDPAYADYPVCQYEGGIPVLYREISLSHPFLSEDGSTRDPGDNWQSKNNYLVSKYITNNRGVKEDLVYQEEPMYVFELDSATIQEIRAENKGHKFDEFELTCTNGGNCISTFFEKYLSGTAATCTSDKGHDISRCDKD